MTETIKLNLDEMIGRFRFLGKNLAPAVYNAMLISAKTMLRDVVKNRMSNPRRGSTATNLGVDTGTARRSMIDQAGMTADAVFALIGSPIDYVKTHEEGFDGIAKVNAHTRRIVALRRNAKGTIIKKSAARYKAALKAKRRTVAYVRAYDRKVDIVAKHFIRDTVLEAVAPTEERILRALTLLATTGKVPSPTTIGAKGV